MNNVHYVALSGAAAVKSEENTENKDDGDIPPLSRGVTGSGRKPRGLTLATSQSVADHKQVGNTIRQNFSTTCAEIFTSSLKFTTANTTIGNHTHSEEYVS